ncbi:MAG: HD-GYP domain-containing protein, partial [Novosphingobium sp.]|nr:HD-GYP domain-containing protein [Novosphingobium sp.]
ERLDGSGYPSGLMGADIDRISRMAAICDAYDTLATGTRSDDGMNPAIVIQAMSSNPGWFDPGLMTAFTETMGSYPVGSIVKLRSQRLAMVVDQDPADHTRPKVRAFYSIAHKRMVSPEDIKLSDCYGEDEIAGIADPDAHGIADFPKLREKLFNGAARSG